MRKRSFRIKMAATIICLGVFLVLPKFASAYVIDIMIGIFLFGFLANAWNLIGGYAGQLSLGHAAFFGIGAYTSTYLLVYHGLNPWIGMLIGAFFGATAGFIVGFLCFRYGLKAAFFALATLAFAEVTRIVGYNWKMIGSSLGILIPLSEGSIGKFMFSEKGPYYYIIFAMMVFSTLLVLLVHRSKMGLYLMAIREDEDAAQSVGIDTTRYKLMAICLSAFLTAMGGTFYAQYIMYISPEEVFGVHLSIEIILRAIIGGTGTVLGPVLGSFALGPLSELARVHLGGYSGVHLMVYGLIVILVVLFLPTGIWPKLHEIFGRFGK